ncbi:DUF445 domain-containing protein [Bacillaceae bacterium]
MDGLWLTLFNVAVGGVIGGMTNWLAVKMLFHPYQAWRIGGWQVPFTPGLIPKRREELALQLGKMVEEYLLTPEGFRRVLREGRLQQDVLRWCERLLDEWAGSRESIRELIGRWLPADRRERWIAAGEEWLQKEGRRFLEEKLQEQEEKRLREVLSPALIAWIERQTENAAVYALQRLRRFLRSPAGVELASRLFRRLLEGGGVFGAMAAMLFRDDKIPHFLLSHVVSALQTQEAEAKAASLIRQEWERWLDLPLREILAKLDSQARERLVSAVVSLFSSSRLLDTPVGEWVSRVRQPLLAAGIPTLVEAVFAKAEKNLEGLLAKVNMTRIVSQEVSAFPLARVEEMILHVSGKEFRMITVLGAVLGGIIGLVQALFWLAF